MPFARPTLGALIRDAQASIAARLPGSDPLLRVSNLNILARLFAGVGHLMFGYLDWIVKQVLPDTAETEFLDRWAAIFGLSRQPAAYAGGTVTLTGINGATLPAGAVLTRADGAAYVTQAAATIASGVASVAVLARAAGAAGNADAGASLALASAVAGIVGVASVAAPGFIGGADLETDTAYRARLLARIQNPPMGGSAADYLAWALAQPGVTRAWVYTLARGAGTVDVTFVMDGRLPGSIIPGSGDVAAVQVALDALRPVTADLLVWSPTGVPLNVTISGLANNTAAVQAAIRQELAAQILLDGAPHGSIYRSRLDEAVSRASGELHHVITLPVGDVTAAAGAIYVPGTVTFV
jgi:uncharacterized phage protein gp47/JayE